jgi:hypothetical protein
MNTVFHENTKLKKKEGKELVKRVALSVKYRIWVTSVALI